MDIEFRCNVERYVEALDRIRELCESSDEAMAALHPFLASEEFGARSVRIVPDTAHTSGIAVIPSPWLEGLIDLGETAA